MLAFLCTWAAAAGLYLLFTGSFGPDELIAAAVCGAAAALWSSAIRHQARQRLAMAPGAFAAAARAIAGLPGAVAAVAARLTVAILLGGGGRLVDQVFERGQQHRPDDAGRRAAAILAASLAPNAFVVRAEESRDELLVHALARTSQNSRWGL